MTGTRPGHLLEIMENDGGIGVAVYADDKGRECHAVFLNVREAKEFLDGLREAIERAEPKRANHKDRVRDPL